MLVGRIDTVVCGTEVRCSSDKVDVVVCVIILLKLDRNKLETRQGISRWNARHDFVELVSIVIGAGVRVLDTTLALGLIMSRSGQLTGSLSSA